MICFYWLFLSVSFLANINTDHTDIPYSFQHYNMLSVVLTFLFNCRTFYRLPEVKGLQKRQSLPNSPQSHMSKSRISLPEIRLHGATISNKQKRTTPSPPGSQSQSPYHYKTKVMRRQLPPLRSRHSIATDRISEEDNEASHLLLLTKQTADIITVKMRQLYKILHPEEDNFEEQSEAENKSLQVIPQTGNKSHVVFNISGRRQFLPQFNFSSEFCNVYKEFV